MQLKKIFLIISVAFGLFSGYGYVKAAAPKQQFNKEQLDKIQAVVEELIQKKPELIEAALRTSLENKEKAQKAAQIKTVKKLAPSLYGKKGDPFGGVNGAKFTIVAFFDPYCGYCKKMEGEIAKMLKTRKDVKVIYKPVAMISKESDAAAREMFAAYKQGKFAQYFSALSQGNAETVADRMAIAQKVGLDTRKLQADAAHKDAAEQLKANIMLGQQLQLTGVPAILIKGGQVINGYVEKDVLGKLIDSSVKA